MSYVGRSSATNVSDMLLVLVILSYLTNERVPLFLQAQSLPTPSDGTLVSHQRAVCLFRSYFLCRVGDRAALAAGGNGTLIAQHGATSLPAVCQLEWTCPLGHSCDPDRQAKVHSPRFSACACRGLVFR